MKKLIEYFFWIGLSILGFKKLSRIGKFMKKFFMLFLWIGISILGFNSLSIAQKNVQDTQNSYKSTSATKNIDFADRMQNPLFVNQITGAMWTLAHDDADSRRCESVINTLYRYLKAFDKNKNGESEQLNNLRGEKTLKNKFMVYGS